MGLNIVEVQYNWANELTERITTGAIVLHHAESTKCTAQDVHRWHLNNGWSGIGYNYFVAKDGTIYKGRGLNAVGAHVEGHNWYTIGICAEGNYHPSDTIIVDTVMPDAQKNSIIQLCVYLFGIYPDCEILGHRDLLATACPGDYFKFDEIKNKVLEEINIGKLINVHPNYYKYGVQAIRDLATNKKLLSNPDEHIVTLGELDENSLDWLNIVVNARMARELGLIK